MLIPVTLALLSAAPCPPAPNDAAVCKGDCEVLLDEPLPRENVSWSLGAPPTPDAYYPFGLEVDRSGTVWALLSAVAGQDRLGERSSSGWKLSPLPKAAGHARFASGCAGSVLVGDQDGSAGVWSRGEDGWRATDQLKDASGKARAEVFGQVWVDGKGVVSAGLFDSSHSLAGFAVGSGTKWAITELTPVNGGVAAPAVALSSRGAPQTAWTMSDPDGTRLRWASPPAKPETVPSSAGAMGTPFLAITREGGGDRSHLFFLTANGNALRLIYATRDAAGAWKASEVASRTGADGLPTLNDLVPIGLLTAGGQVRLVYGIAESSDLRPPVERAEPQGLLGAPSDPGPARGGLGGPGNGLREPASTSGLERPRCALEIAWPQSDGIGRRKVFSAPDFDWVKATVDSHGAIHLLRMDTGAPGQVLPLRHVVIGKRSGR